MLQLLEWLYQTSAKCLINKLVLIIRTRLINAPVIIRSMCVCISLGKSIFRPSLIFLRPIDPNKQLRGNSWQQCGHRRESPSQSQQKDGTDRSTLQ